MRGHGAVAHVLSHTHRGPAEGPDLSALNHRLDSLWTSYLHLLDQYTQAQVSITKHTSSAFLSLAHANSQSAGLGRRYGQDYYDDRTSATTKVHVVAAANGSLPQARIVKAAQSGVEDDPIRWFGILLPPSLRHAQTSFTSAVLDDDALARASNAARGMRLVEVEIRKLRKTIGKAEKRIGVEDIVVD